MHGLHLQFKLLIPQFEVPKASDQQLVNQTDRLHSNTGQEIFDRLLASTILVRSNTDDKIIINNPEDIKPDVFRVLKEVVVKCNLVDIPIILVK